MTDPMQIERERLVAELRRIGIEREKLVAEHAAALHLVSRLELALRRIGAHAAPDQQLLREAARFLELAGLRSSAGLHAAASPPWAGEPAPWKRGG